MLIVIFFYHIHDLSYHYPTRAQGSGHGRRSVTPGKGLAEIATHRLQSFDWAFHTLTECMDLLDQLTSLVE